MKRVLLIAAALTVTAVAAADVIGPGDDEPFYLTRSYEDQLTRVAVFSGPIGRENRDACVAAANVMTATWPGYYFCQ